MSEANSTSPDRHDTKISYPTPVSLRKPSLVKIGGGMGIAAGAIGLAIFISACAGFSAVFVMAIIPLLLAGGGLILSIGGGIFQKNAGVEDTQVMAALFVNVIGLIGALVEIAAWREWLMFYAVGG